MYFVELNYIYYFAVITEFKSLSDSGSIYSFTYLAIANRSTNSQGSRLIVLKYGLLKSIGNAEIHVFGSSVSDSSGSVAS